ncbi:MarR family transcriptional regulator [Pseudonocardia ailaonensis]|uniref:MarR family transcriptional regulator n=1 Tax=Pseudonocardia ailaonensis TaxID=367279 RepID=A0ABN2MV86_9PSEU
MTTPQHVEADLGWALGKVMRAHLRTAQEVVAGLPGGPRGYQVLVEAANGGPGNQLALAQKLGVDRTVMTYLLDELEKAELVRRQPDPADRRARQIVITDAGRGRLCDLERRLRAAEEALLSPLDAAEQGQLRALLAKLATDAGPADACAAAEQIENC